MKLRLRKGEQSRAERVWEGEKRKKKSTTCLISEKCIIKVTRSERAVIAEHEYSMQHMSSPSMTKSSIQMEWETKRVREWELVSEWVSEWVSKWVSVLMNSAHWDAATAYACNTIYSLIWLHCIKRALTLSLYAFSLNS